jgi:uncharacterized protein involved in exopolysaccharide biosynthesis
MPDGIRQTPRTTRDAVVHVWDEPSPAGIAPGGLLQICAEAARSHRWRMASVAALTVAVSAFAYPHLPRRYEASAQVILQPTGQDGQSDFAREARNSLNENGIQSEMEILSSRPLAAEVSRRLHLVEDPAFNPSRRPDGWRSAVRRAAADALAQAGITLPPKAGPARPGAEELAVEHKVLEHLAVKRDRRSYVLRVGFWSHDPDQAAAMANTLATAYVEAQLERKRDAQTKLTDWIDSRVAELSGRHKRSEQAVEHFLVETGLADAAADAALQQQLTTLSGELALVQSRSLDLQARFRALGELQRSGALESAPEVIALPLVQHLRERVVTLGAGVGSTTGGGPLGAPQSAINELRQAVGVEAQRVLRGAETDASVAQQREASLRAEILRIREELTRRRMAERRLDSLPRESTADREALDQAMARHRIELGRVAALRPDAEILTRAEAPLDAAFPNGKMAALGTLALALVAAMASILPQVLRRRLAA